MILGPEILLKLVKTKKLVENLSERELTNPEGAGFDFRLGEVYKISGKSFLGVTERQTADIELVEKYVEGETRSFTWEPGDFYLVKTIETVNMPEDLSANITPRSTLFRSGLYLRTGNCPPGYSGGWTFALKNEGTVPVTIEMGARIAHAQFMQVLGGGNMYRGQWQGGRVSATKKETQV